MPPRQRGCLQAGFVDCQLGRLPARAAKDTEMTPQQVSKCRQSGTGWWSTYTGATAGGTSTAPMGIQDV